MITTTVNDPARLIQSIDVVGETEGTRGEAPLAMIYVKWRRRRQDGRYAVRLTRTGAKLFLAHEPTREEAVITFEDLPFRRKDLMAHVVIESAPGRPRTRRKAKTLPA